MAGGVIATAKSPACNGMAVWIVIALEEFYESVTFIEGTRVAKLRT